MPTPASNPAASPTPVLEFEDATLAPRADHDAGVYRFSLRLMPSELVLILVDSPALRFPLADLASGLLWPESGRVRFLSQEWRTLGPARASRLRSRIGRVFPPAAHASSAPAAWLPSMHLLRAILLPHLCHDRGSHHDLLARATQLCEYFSMPGLPLTTPDAISSQDLSRCECVRAVLSDPDLLLLECPMASAGFGAAAALVNLVHAQRARGTCVLWTTHSQEVFSLPALRPTARLRLVGSALAPIDAPPALPLAPVASGAAASEETP